MKKRFAIVAAAVAGLTIGSSLQAADTAFNPEQQKAIQSIVHDYLISNPEVLVQASQALQKKQQQTMMAQSEKAITANADALFNGASPVVGNPKGSVTIVEFFDYQCVHCKKMAPVMKAVMAANPNVRVVYKDFPIFGKESDLAAKAAIAAQSQGKYWPLHEVLITEKGRLNQAMVMEAAKKAGLDMAKLQTALKSPEISQAISANRQLAERLKLMGTPAFVVAATPGGKYVKGGRTFFLPGATSEATLNSLIKQATQ